jgi:hypothetical protein
MCCGLVVDYRHQQLGNNDRVTSMQALTSAVLVTLLGLSGWLVTPGTGSVSDSGSRAVTLGTGCCKTAQ